MRCTVAAVAALALGGLASTAAAASSYGIVIDAGSSGSRLHVYRWPRREFEEDTALPPRSLTVPIDLDIALKARPGVDSPAGVEALRGVVQQARQLPMFQDAAVASKTAIWLKATAGLRIVPPGVRDRQLASVRAMLRTSGFLFASDSQARVISGEEEGVYGWVAVNYALGLLNSTGPGMLTGSVGALDLGGASTQITFKPSTPDILSNSFDLRLGGAVVESLYTHSFLYFGQNEALTRAHQAALYAAWPAFPAGPAPTRVTTPCLFAGYETAFTDPATGAAVTLVGNGSMAECRGGPLASLLDRRAVCLTVPRPTLDRPSRALRALPSPAPAVNASAPGCSAAGVYQPPAAGSRFVAFSGFAFVWGMLGMPVQGGTLRDFESRVAGLCSLSWAAAQAQYNGTVPSQFLRSYCFLGSFSLALLTDAYGIDADDPAALRVAPSADTYGWALGSIIYEANALPFSLLGGPPAPPSPFEPAFYGVLGLLLVVVAVGAVAALRAFGYCRPARRAGDSTTAPLRKSRPSSGDVHNPLADA